MPLIGVVSTSGWCGQHFRLVWSALPVGVVSTSSWCGQHFRERLTIVLYSTGYERFFFLKLIKQIKLINLIKKLKKIRLLKASIFFNSKRRENPIYQNENSIYQNDKGLSFTGKRKRGEIRAAAIVDTGWQGSRFKCDPLIKRVSNAESKSAVYHP